MYSLFVPLLALIQFAAPMMQLTVLGPKLRPLRMGYQQQRDKFHQPQFNRSNQSNTDQEKQESRVQQSDFELSKERSSALQTPVELDNDRNEVLDAGLSTDELKVQQYLERYASNDTALSQSEQKDFVFALERVISMLTLEIEEEVGPTASDQATTSSKTSPFVQLQGQSSTWQVEGIEKMSTEEYYQALNRRNREVRDRLREDGAGQGAQQVDDYLDSLRRSSKEIARH